MKKESTVFNNHIFSRLREHVIFENEISRAREDFESYLFTLYAPSLVRSAEEQIIKTSELNNINLNEINSLSRIKEFAYYIGLSSRLGLNLTKDQRDTFASLLNDLIDSSAYPDSSKSIICWVLRDIKEFKSQTEKLEEQLEKKALDAFSRFNYQEGLEIAFGVKSDKCISKVIENPIQFTNEALKWSRDKLSKSIIRLTDVTNFDVSNLVNELERKIEDELSSWIEPDVWLAVIESEKIINSNIPQDDINEVMENLASSSKSWAKIVDDISKDGIHLRLNSVIKSPAFSPIEDTFSLIALHMNERERTIQLSEREFEELTIYSGKLGLVAFSKVSLSIYMATITIIVAYLAYFFISTSNSQVGFIATLKDPLEHLLNGEFGSLLSKTNILIMAFGYSIWWLLILVKKPFLKGELTLKSYFNTIPIISKIAKSVKND